MIKKYALVSHGAGPAVSRLLLAVGVSVSGSTVCAGFPWQEVCCEHSEPQPHSESPAGAGDAGSLGMVLRAAPVTVLPSLLIHASCWSARKEHRNAKGILVLAWELSQRLALGDRAPSAGHPLCLAVLDAFSWAGNSFGI